MKGLVFQKVVVCVRVGGGGPKFVIHLVQRQTSFCVLAKPQYSLVYIPVTKEKMNTNNLQLNLKFYI